MWCDLPKEERLMDCDCPCVIWYNGKFLGCSHWHGCKKMGEKTLVLARKTNVLRIYNEDDSLRGITYTAIYDITGLKTNGEGWYDIYNKGIAVGFVSGVKEVKEKW